MASAASFAAGVARDAEEQIRNLASSVLGSSDASVQAIDLLVQQHREVEKLFDAIESPSAAKKGDVSAVLTQIADRLAAHMMIEERIFYPEVRKVDPEIILEGLEEHAMGRFALKRLLASKATDDSRCARTSALSELMKDHHEEEEDDLFPKVKKSMSSEALEAMGKRMKALFDAEVQRGHEAVLASFDDDVPSNADAKRARSAKSTTRVAPTKAKVVASAKKASTARRAPAKKTKKKA